MKKNKANPKTAENNKSRLPLMSLAFAVIGLLVAPIIFGPLAVASGAIALKNGQARKERHMCYLGVAVGVINIVFAIMMLYAK